MTRSTLKEIRERIDKSEEIVVDRHGTIRLPDDPKVAKNPETEKTKLKPSRWY